MTVSFLDNFAPREKSPTLTVPSPAVGNCPSEPTAHVGESRLSRAQLEAAIRRGLADANYHEAKARHFRALVAQLKEMTDGQA